MSEGLDKLAELAKYSAGKLAWSIFGVGGLVAGLIVGLLVCLIFIGAAGGATGADSEKGKEHETDTIMNYDGGYECVPGGDKKNIPAKYYETVKETARKARVPISILAAQIARESQWDPKAESPDGARGISQIMPGTWAEFADGADPWDPIASIEVMGKIMSTYRDIVRRTVDFGVELGDTQEEMAEYDSKLLDLTLAAYNAGPGAVQEYSGVPPYEETQTYISEIHRLAQEKYAEKCDDVVGDLGKGKWTHPLPGSAITSPFGPRNLVGTNFHYGTDFAGGQDYIVAPTDMKITLAEDGHYAYGTWIIAEQIDDPKYVIEFHHFVNGSLKVKAGQKVAAGTPLALQGATGNVTGRHLHYQMAKPGTDPKKATMYEAVDPVPILQKAGVL